MKKAKLIIILVVSLLAIIVFLQNTETVETKFLFSAITMPRAILLILMFITGFVAGLITASYVVKNPRKPAASA